MVKDKFDAQRLMTVSGQAGGSELLTNANSEFKKY